jgi:hydroxymethylpyrimidine pyrophosphatase-like HAD family hydrolase
MRYHALACDYDGTIAHHGRVDQPTLAALERVLASGRKLILVTGRELPELQSIFPELPMFSYVVGENGALLYRPETKEVKLLHKPPPPAFVERLRALGVAPMSVGQVIIGTWHPHETAILEAIRDMGMEMQVIFNKDAVMVLPSGVNKASGLKAALKEMKLTPHEVVAVGDAENDHAMLSLCECGAAVANALPALKERADIVATGDHGRGVAELIDSLVGNDLAEYELRLVRHHLEVGTDVEGQPVKVPPYGSSLMIAGPSGSGKSTAASTLLERLVERKYQFCLVDPEGDYEGFPGTVALGTAQRGPSIEEVLQLLSTSLDNPVLNLVGISVTDRPGFFLGLLPRVLELRARTGRPHWLVVDEAHHLLPASWEPGALIMPPDVSRTLYITVHPDQVAPVILSSVETLIAVGADPAGTIGKFCAAVKESVPEFPDLRPEPGEVIFWSRRSPREPRRVRMTPSKAERRRHIRKYAEGELPPDRSFYFRGPQQKLNLRCQNLILFLQTGDGVDDETWLFHLKHGDYSQWFRERIKDPELAEAAAAIERDEALSAAKSRAEIRKLVEQSYTRPAGPVLPMPGTDAAPKHE